MIYNISRLTTQITTAQKATKNGECLLSVPSAIDIKTSKENTPVTQCNRTAQRKCFFTKRQISAGCLLLCRVLPGSTAIGSHRGQSAALWVFAVCNDQALNVMDCVTHRLDSK